MLLANTLYLLALTLWIGTILFFTFIGTTLIFKTLSKEEAGKVVGVIFKKYFPIGYLSGFLALACVIYSAAKTSHWPFMKITLLVVMITTTIFSSLITYPKARAYKEELRASADETEKNALQIAFKKAHRTSVIQNLAVLLMGIGLIIATAIGLRI